MTLLAREPSSPALAREIDRVSPVLVACTLLETELRRVAHRKPALTQQAVTAFLNHVEIADVPPSLFRDAGLLPGPTLRSLDALHLAAALRLRVGAVATYDLRMARSALDLGLAVVAPD